MFGKSGDCEGAAGRRVRVAASFLLMACFVSGCAAESGVEETGISIATYPGGVNLDAAALTGELTTMGGCLALTNDTSRYIIAVSDSQKSELENLLTKGELQPGDRVTLPGSISQGSNADINLPDGCGSFTEIWRAGNIQDFRYGANRTSTS